MKASGQQYGVAAVDRAVAVLNSFQGSSSHSLAEVARRAGLSEATALRYLSTLSRHKLVEREEMSGQYRLGMHLFRLGQRARDGRNVPRIALPFMQRLLERFEETVNLCVRHGDELIIIEALESTRSIKKGSAVGELDSWHASSLGKAFLAYLPEDEVQGILNRRGLPRYTSSTFVTWQEMIAELNRVREAGYAIDNEESENGLCCVGAPIFDERNRPTYAISLSGPANRFSANVVVDMAKELRSVASAVSIALGRPGQFAINPDDTRSELAHGSGT